MLIAFEVDNMIKFLKSYDTGKNWNKTVKKQNK